MARQKKVSFKYFANKQKKEKEKVIQLAGGEKKTVKGWPMYLRVGFASKVSNINPETINPDYLFSEEEIDQFNKRMEELRLLSNEELNRVEKAFLLYENVIEKITRKEYEEKPSFSFKGLSEKVNYYLQPIPSIFEQMVRHNFRVHTTSSEIQHLINFESGSVVLIYFVLKKLYETGYAGKKIAFTDHLDNTTHQYAKAFIATKLFEEQLQYSDDIQTLTQQRKLEIYPFFEPTFAPPQFHFYSWLFEDSKSAVQNFIEKLVNTQALPAIQDIPNSYAAFYKLFIEDFSPTLNTFHFIDNQLNINFSAIE